MSTRDRIRNFLAPQSEYEQTLLKLYSEGGQMGGPGADRGSVFSQKNNIFRDIPVMVADPIIGSSLALIMETAFQPTDDSELFRVSSDHPAIVNELEAFHRDMNMDESLLTIAYNILIYGNLPVKHFYSKEYRYERFEFVPDFRKVVPIVLANRVLGYNVEGEFAFPYEYTYGQHLYFKDLGGPSSSSRRGSIRGKGDEEKKVENGFVVAPSYLSPAARPWRSIKIVEDALLLQRMDLSTYMRIIGVKVGDNVFTKNAVRLLNFYRQVFKKVRRVSYDGDGMSSSSFGNEYEVVLPITDSQGLDVKDIGGQVDIRALRDLDILYKKLFSALRVQPSMVGFCLRGDTKISMLDGTEVAIGEMYRDQEKFVGKQVYTCDSEGRVSFAKIKRVMMNRPSTNFVRVTLDNGEHFDVTPDHPCQLRDGSYVPARELHAGSSLMPLYRDSYRGYETYQDNYLGKWAYTHRQNSGDNDGLVVHHRDRNKRNNDAENLQVMTKAEHSREHLLEKRMLDFAFIAKARESQRKARMARKASTGTPCTERELEVKRSAIKKALTRLKEIRANPDHPISVSWREHLSNRETPWMFGDRNVMNDPAVRERQREGVKRSFANGHAIWRQKPEWKDLASAASTKANKSQWSSGPVLELKCVLCEEPFSKHYKLRNDGVYNTEGLRCPACDRSARKKAKRKGETLPRQNFNHKVASVEYLDVVEDAYDIEVDSPNHNFALTAGVFVHNSEDVPSSLGESGAVQRWDERFGRLVKAIRLSTVKVIKEIDTFFLRSRGYDVNERDFHYTFVATSTVEDEERRTSFTDNVKALTETIAALESSKVKFNRDYLVKEYFAKAFASTAIDTEKLFGQEPVKRLVSSSESLIDIDDNTIALYGAVKLLDEKTLAAIKSDSKDHHDNFKLEGMPLQPILSYRRFLSLGDSLSSGYEVDLSTEIRVIADMDSRKSGFKSVTNVPVPPNTNIFSDTTKLSADALASGRIAEIEDLYLVDGGYYLTGNDLINYLFMLDRGLNSIPAKRVWKED